MIHGFFVDGVLRGVAELRPLGAGLAGRSGGRVLDRDSRGRATASARAAGADFARGAQPRHQASPHGVPRQQPAHGRSGAEIRRRALVRFRQRRRRGRGAASDADVGVARIHRRHSWLCHRAARRTGEDVTAGLELDCSAHAPRTRAPPAARGFGGVGSSVRIEALRVGGSRGRETAVTPARGTPPRCCARRDRARTRRSSSGDSAGGAGRAVVPAAGRQRRLVERVDRRAVVRGDRDVHALVSPPSPPIQKSGLPFAPKPAALASCSFCCTSMITCSRGAPSAFS